MSRPPGSLGPRFPLRSFTVAIVLAPLTSLFAQSRPAGRILGVFDEVTFEPIAGALVTDLGTGTRAVTTATGTISLAYLDTGTTVLQIRKLGYEGRMLHVTVSPVDTVSITVVMRPLVQTLPVVESKAPLPVGDYRWKLNAVGFTDRQRSLGAPPSAFVTAEQIAKWRLTLLSDLKSHTGRGVCGDVYLDGNHIDMTPLATRNTAAGANPYRQGIDELINPEDVAGIEIYTAAEAPQRYYQPAQPISVPTIVRGGGRGAATATAPTQSAVTGGAIRRAPSSSFAPCAVTLIWTR